MTNAYSAAWFDLFLAPLPEAQTSAEIAFVARQLPQPAYHAVLDLCCGAGRHARALAALGYEVLGLDQHGAALASARHVPGPRVVYRQGDMRDLAALPGPFDAVVNLWQSFGYFDAAGNAAVLRQIHAKLKPRGRLILDIYHRGFFVPHAGEQVVERDGRTIRDHKQMSGDRLRCRLDYGPDLPADEFEWQLYTPEEMIALARGLGFVCRLACSGFRETQPASAATPRMQLVFEKAVAAGSGEEEGD